MCIPHVSVNGCRREDEDTPLVVGETICLSLGAVETLGAAVICTKRNAVGVADVFGYPNPREALKAADEALYLTKESGRNRILIADRRTEA